jgi:plasmid stabilization system protein ParE
VRLELIVRPEAEAEMGEAFDWYEERVPGLGSDFLLNVDAAFNAIRRKPQQFPLVHKNLRRALIRRFPFQVFFVLEEQRIVVLAVFHSRRSPKRWMERAGGKQ